MGHLVQAASQLPDFVPAPLSALPVEVQPGHFLGDAAESDDRSGDIARVSKGAQKGKDQQHQQQPRGHLDQRPHRQIFRLHPRGDIERIGILSIGKPYFGDNGVLFGHGDGNHITGHRGTLCPGDGGVRLSQVAGCRDYHGAVLIQRLDGQLGTSVGERSVRTDQHSLGSGRTDEIVQQRPTVTI